MFVIICEAPTDDLVISHIFNKT